MLQKKTVSVDTASATAATDQFTYTLAPGNMLFNVVVKRAGQVVTLYSYEHEENNQVAADLVMSLISEIDLAPTSTYANEKKDAIAARTEYNKLTAVQKALVTNYSTLTEMESIIDAFGKAYADVAALDGSDISIYTPASWSAFKAAFAVAKAMPEDTIAQVIEKTDAINAALNLLVKAQ